MFFTIRDAKYRLYSKNKKQNPQTLSASCTGTEHITLTVARNRYVPIALGVKCDLRVYT
jgi:hypothetical protein